MAGISWTSLGRGTVVGAGAFLVGYAVTWILAGAKAAGLTVGGPFGGQIPDWRATLWLFYDSHFAGTRTARVFGPDGNLWGGGDLVITVDLLGVEYLYAMAPLVLVLAGAAVVAWTGTTGARAGFAVGATVAVGYLALVFLGLFVASQGGTGPSPLRALVIAGVVYPVAFGALGGAVAGQIERGSADRAANPAH